MKFADLRFLAAASAVVCGVASADPGTAFSSAENLIFDVPFAQHGNVLGDGSFDGSFPFVPFVAYTSTSFSNRRDTHFYVDEFGGHNLSATFDVQITTSDMYSQPFIQALLCR